MIQFTCQQCQESLEAPLSLKGENLQCPKCGFEQTIPGSSSTADSTNESNPAAGDFEGKTGDAPTQQAESHAAENIVETSGHRPILINSIGEIIMTENSKSVACPVQDHRCRYSCAWFSIDYKANTAMCQGRIVIGSISRNEYGQEDSKATHRWS